MCAIPEGIKKYKSIIMKKKETWSKSIVSKI